MMVGKRLSSYMYLWCIWDCHIWSHYKLECSVTLAADVDHDTLVHIWLPSRHWQWASYLSRGLWQYLCTLEASTALTGVSAVPAQPDPSGRCLSRLYPSRWVTWLNVVHMKHAQSLPFPLLQTLRVGKFCIHDWVISVLCIVIQQTHWQHEANTFDCL